MQDERGSPRNWVQMRDRVDRGETGDKVAAEDPAAAPLGTDAEAGGAGTPAPDIATSARAEAAGTDPGKTGESASGTGRQATPFVLVVVGLALAALVAVLVASY